MLKILPLFVLAACGPGTIEFDDNKDGTGADSGLTTDDTGEEVEPEPEVHPYAGTYTGEFNLLMVERDYEYCAGEMTLTVNEDPDEDGELTGEGGCVGEGGWGDDPIYPVTFTGNVNEDGEVEGDVVIEVDFGWGDPQIFETELGGEFTDGEAELTWTQMVNVGWGGEQEFVGNGELELQDPEDEE